MRPTAAQAQALVQERKDLGVSQMAIAIELDLNRVTVWKYELQPHRTPEGFWQRYAAATKKIAAKTAAKAAADKKSG